MHHLAKALCFFIILKCIEKATSFFVQKLHIFHLTASRNGDNLPYIGKKCPNSMGMSVRRKGSCLKSHDEEEDGETDETEEMEDELDEELDETDEENEQSEVEETDSSDSTLASRGSKKVTTGGNKVKAEKIKKRKRKKKSTNVIKCRTCNKILKPRVKFCAHCGTNVSVEKIKLKKYIEDIYLPLRKEEVSDNTYRVEKGFWNDILPVKTCSTRKLMLCLFTFCISPFWAIFPFFFFFFFFSKKLGKYELHELGANNWEGFLKYLKSKNCSPRTMALYQSTYQQSLKYALYRDYLKSVHNFRKIKNSTIPRRKITPLSPKEIELLLTNSGDMHRAIFALSIGIGLRPSEVLRILWEDINFEKKEIFIKGQKTKYSNTAIPMTNFAYNELVKWWEIEKKPLKGLCFYSETIKNKFNYTNTKTPLKTFKTALKGAAKRAGLEISEDGKKRRIFPYLLRHSFATIAATSNPPVPLPVAQAIMRHSSSKMLLDTYTKAGNNIIRDGLDNFKI
ncbi:tyrosine recombinase, putative [Plasmodium knowlesi strain H]|uniref:Tyrosine recombinase, putative n=2 Tax=Plasmodium TaxID=5820 RepID=A0A193RCN3_PLAKH|nr:tyrosine recombinase, putative [Plasmodium knowlesi strain H]